MRFDRVFIPYGAWWSSPFCRWQGGLSGEHPLRLAAKSTSIMLEQTGRSPADIGGIHLGMTVPQHHSFFGTPWFGAMFGATQVTGPTISQACATSARVIASAAAAVELGAGGVQLAVSADRTSNGPIVYYPDPAGPGGAGKTENWVLDNFSNDPYAKVAMIETAENIAAKFGFTRQDQEDLTLRRYEQYEMALADDRSFQRRYMQELTIRRGRNDVNVDADEGVVETTRQGVERLKPVLEGGTVTYATQTHPADGNAGLLVGSRDAAGLAGANGGVTVQLLSFGEGRAEKAHMGMAPVPAAEAAMAAAGITFGDIAAVKTHNPFAVNDLYFATRTGYPAEKMNNYGSSLIFGHPQGPTGLRLVVELIEELVLLGGGIGLFTGCAAGDTGAAIVLKVG